MESAKLKSVGAKKEPSLTTPIRWLLADIATTKDANPHQNKTASSSLTNESHAANHSDCVLPVDCLLLRLGTVASSPESRD